MGVRENDKGPRTTLAVFFNILGEEMPIYAYRCQKCSHNFESLIQGSTIPECPKCQGRKLEKQLTAFAVGATEGGADFGGGPGACGSCGDPRGPGSCSLN